MHVLVTGGAGFVGSNLVEQLLKMGYEVSVFDDLSGGQAENLKGLNCEFHQGDIRDFRHLPRVTENVDAIFHLATRKMVHSVAQPFKDLDVNAGGMLNVLEVAKKQKVPVVYTSTGSVYGNPSQIPTLESCPPNPIAPYGVSKYAAEGYCRVYNVLHGVETVILRLHSVYGPRGRTIAVIPKFIQQALNGEAYTVEGDGMQKRPFTYVGDCVDGIVTVWQHGEAGETYNVAGKKLYSILDVTNIISNVLDIGVNLKFTTRKKGDFDLAHPSTDKIGRLGWNAKVDLEEGVKKTVDWLRENKTK